MRHEADRISTVFVEDCSQRRIPSGNANLDTVLLITAEPQITALVWIDRMSRQIQSAAIPRRLDLPWYSDPSWRHKAQIFNLVGTQRGQRIPITHILMRGEN